MPARSFRESASSCSRRTAARAVAPVASRRERARSCRNPLVRLSLLVIPCSSRANERRDCRICGRRARGPCCTKRFVPSKTRTRCASCTSRSKRITFTRSSRRTTRRRCRAACRGSASASRRVSIVCGSTQVASSRIDSMRALCGRRARSATHSRTCCRMRASTARLRAASIRSRPARRSTDGARRQHGPRRSSIRAFPSIDPERDCSASAGAGTGSSAPTRCLDSGTKAAEREPTDETEAAALHQQLLA